MFSRLQLCFVNNTRNYLNGTWRRWHGVPVLLWMSDEAVAAAFDVDSELSSTRRGGDRKLIEVLEKVRALIAQAEEMRAVNMRALGVLARLRHKLAIRRILAEYDGLVCEYLEAKENLCL